MKSATMKPETDFISQVIPGAKHNEGAWSARFGDGLQFFFAK
jgi:hypothetical protein